MPGPSVHHNMCNQVTNWHPARLFEDAQPQTPYAILVLNQPLNARTYEKLARYASMIVCADGGANRLHKILQENKQLWHGGFPTAIVGDLDSLRDDVRDFFEDAGRTEIVHVPEQDSTDFTKALRWLRNESSTLSGDRMDVVALGGLGGRVDQAFSIIHHLLKAVDDRELLCGDMYLVSEQSLSFVLGKGRNITHGLAPGQNKVFQENVGIIPIRGAAEITTVGLEWDVKDWKTEFGGQISTSNHIKADVVEIESSDQVLLTIELADALCKT